MVAIERSFGTKDKFVQQAEEMSRRVGCTFDEAYQKILKGRLSRTSVGTGVVVAQNDFMAEAEKLMSEKKITRGAAVRILARENPKLHEAWLASLQPTPTE